MLWRITKISLQTLVIISCGIALVWGIHWSANWAAVEVSPIPSTSIANIDGVLVEIVIPQGMAAASIFRLLEEEGIVKSSQDIEQVLARRNAVERMQAGTYELETGMELAELADILLEGGETATYTVTVIEGLRVEEILKSLAKQTPYTVADYQSIMKAGGVTSKYLPDSKDLEVGDHELYLTRWEGLLGADTYKFGDDTSAWVILQTLSDTAEKRIDSVDWGNIRRKGYSVYEGLIVASLIEAEVLYDDERDLVSGVIWNRLSDDMLLGIDATVLYGVDVRGRAPNLDELNTSNVYNTRKIHGLPPTPIAAPRLDSMIAAGAPGAHEYRYYVVVTEDGHHGFAETLEEFNILKQQSRADGLF